MRRPRRGTNAVVPRGRRAALEAGGAPPRRGSAEGQERVRVGLSRLSPRAARVRRGTEAATGRSDATRRGFTACDGEGGAGPPPAHGVKSGSANAPPAGTGGGGDPCSSCGQGGFAGMGRCGTSWRGNQGERRTADVGRL